MNTYEIDSILFRDAEVAKCYGGTLACNQLPLKIKKFPICFVVNTSSGEGEHWISFYLLKKGYVEIFCSFGTSPKILSTIPPIYQFLINFGYRKITYNKFCLQYILSSYCGLYAILYLKVICRKHSMRRLISCFSKNPETNDQIIEYIKGIIIE